MPAAPFERHAPRRILLICTRRIGDVLLATPLARSLKRAWPQAELDFLAFEGTTGVLEGNPDIAHIIAVPPKSDWRGKLAQLRQLWRRYDLAVSTIASDRARLYGWAGARFRIGCVGDGETGKTLLLNRWLRFDDRDTHTVTMGLRLAELLAIEPCRQVVPPALDGAGRAALRKRLPAALARDYAVLHPFPKYAYKMWRQEGWVELAEWLQQCGLAVALSGGPDADERAYVRSIAQRCAAIDLSGQLSLAETADLIAHARLYVGPDTATTHIAAALGTPTIALFGPSNPVKWGPWPCDWASAQSPWPWRGGGAQGNVRLIQGPGDCVPCMLEGCDRHLNSTSQCLLRIGTSTLTEAAGALLQGRP